MSFSLGVCPWPWALASILSASTIEASSASLGSGTTAAIWAHAGLSLALPTPWPLALDCTSCTLYPRPVALLTVNSQPPSLLLSRKLENFYWFLPCPAGAEGDLEGMGGGVFWSSLCLYSTHCHFHCVDAVLCWHRSMGDVLLLEFQVGIKIQVRLLCSFQTQLDFFTMSSCTQHTPGFVSEG